MDSDASQPAKAISAKPAPTPFAIEPTRVRAVVFDLGGVFLEGGPSNVAAFGERVGLARENRDLRTRSAVRVERLNGGRVRVTVALDDAKSAAIAGDWNDWSPAPMSRTKAGRWTTVIQVVPGVHRFSILVDGTRWIVPSGAPQASDGFGGQAALLVIPDA